MVAGPKKKTRWVLSSLSGGEWRADEGCYRTSPAPVCRYNHIDRVKELLAIIITGICISQRIKKTAKFCLMLAVLSLGLRCTRKVHTGGFRCATIRRLKSITATSVGTHHRRQPTLARSEAAAAMGAQDNLGASVRAIRPKSGLPNLRIFEDGRRAERFVDICAALRRRGVTSDQATEREASRLIGRLQHFMGTHMGRHLAANAPPAPITKFSALFFEDYRADGPLFCILSAIFQYVEDHGIGRLDFRDDSNIALHFDILAHVEKELKKNRFINLNRVYLAPTIESEQAGALRSILQRHDAAVVSTPGVATHIVYPDPPGTREHETDGQVLIRLMDREGRPGGVRAHVHWWYHPDSYNEWILAREVVGHVEQRRPTQPTPHHVHARWVRDLDLYNEWMTVLDYEMPSSFDAFLGHPPTYATHYGDTPGAITVIPLDGDNPNARIRLRLRMPEDDERRAKRPRTNDDAFHIVGLPSIDTEDTVNGKSLCGPNEAQRDLHGEEGGFKEVGSSESSVDLDGMSTPDREAAIAAQVHRNEAENFSIPPFTSWFEIETIHDIEKRGLPEFFSGKFASKTPSVYRQLRDFMIRTWRKAPSRYLTATAARRHLYGDACSILRVHNFLEHWGLINHKVSAEKQPAPLFAPPPRPLPTLLGRKEDPNKRHRALLTLDDGAAAELRGNAVIRIGKNGFPATRSYDARSGLIRCSDEDANAVEIDDARVRDPIEYHCDGAGCAADCSRLRFHCAAKADMDLCPACYKSANYPSHMQPRDFIQMTSVGADGGEQNVDSRVWTESETLLLLEALEMFGDRWNLVSEHVGSKAEDECVMQFIRLPIEDTFLSSTQEKWWPDAVFNADTGLSPIDVLKKAGAKESALAAIAAKGSSIKSLTGQPLVYADQINTITPHVALLSSLVPPAVLRKVLQEARNSAPENIAQVKMTDLASRDSLGEDAVPAAETHWTLAECNGLSSAPDASGASQKDALSSVRGIITDLPCRDRMNEIPSLDAICESDVGARLAKSALASLRFGAPASVDDLDTVRETLKARIALKKVETDSDSAPVGLGSSEGPSLSLMNAAVDDVSAKAVGVTALAAAACRAEKLLLLEKAEIDRLLTLTIELKLQMVRMKTKHLEDILEHENLSRVYETREACESFAERLACKLAPRSMYDHNRPDKRLSVLSLDVATGKSIADTNLPVPAISGHADDSIHEMSHLDPSSTYRLYSVPSRSPVMPPPPLPPLSACIGLQHNSQMSDYDLHGTALDSVRESSVRVPYPAQFTTSLSQSGGVSPTAAQALVHRSYPRADVLPNSDSVGDSA